jgi:hypothetical protein
MRFVLAGLLILPALTGCAATTVRPNPGKWDRGIRYYRPKPYLLVQPEYHQGTVPEPGFVKINLEWLPDFSEEYSIHIRAGLGINKTHVTLSNGWNLTQLNVDIDQNVDDNIKAVAELLGTIPKLAPPAARGAERTLQPLRAAAHNVPIGYYEAIVSKDHQGHKGEKRLYGWRYVGFAPFNVCPTESGGVQCEDCQTADIYGLVFENDRLVFRRLTELAQP